MLPDQRGVWRIRRLVTRRHVALTLLAAALCLAATVRAGPLDPGLAAEACAGCHGEVHDESTPIADLASLSPAAIVEAMAAFRSGERDNPVMSRIARAYSTVEVAALAEVLGKRTDCEAGND